MVSLAEHLLVCRLDNGRADGGFLRIGKPQLFEYFPHAVDADAAVIGNEGRRKADIYRRAALNQNLDLFRFVHNLLGVLGADHKALPAQNTLVPDDMRLVAGKPDGFDRTVPDTLIAVLAIGLFECQTIRHRSHLLIPLLAPRAEWYRSRNHGTRPW